MPLLDYQPHCIALYLDKPSQDYYSRITPAILKNYLDLFSRTIQSMFPEATLLTNGKVLMDASSTDTSATSVEAQPEKIKLTFLDAQSESDFFSQILKHLPASRSGTPDWDEVCFLYFEGVAPLLDGNLTSKLWERHKKYFSQYSYSENLPPGIVPRILTREFLDSLPAQWKGSSHDYFLKNINHYDVDIFFHHPDLRQYRFNLFPNQDRSHFLVAKLLENVADEWSYDKLLPSILEHPEWMRPSPAWIELEIYRGCELKCSFCPRQFLDSSDQNFALHDGLEMSPNFLDSLVESLNGMPGESTFCLGGMGEPLLHSDLTSVLKSLLATKQLKEIIIESALYLESSRWMTVLDQLTKEEKAKVHFIINLTTNDSLRYKNIYGEDRFSTVKDNIDKLIQVLPKENISVQIIKIKEVETEVDAYFDHYEKQGINIIFQKYNRYAGLMPEKRVSDLTPLVREFCWHLGRDLYVNANGEVSICRQEPNPNGKHILGNLNKESLSDIWKKGLPHFKESLHGNLDSIPAPCLNCDEWYTFNA